MFEDEQLNTDTQLHKIDRPDSILSFAQKLNAKFSTVVRLQVAHHKDWTSLSRRPVLVYASLPVPASSCNRIVWRLNSAFLCCLTLLWTFSTGCRCRIKAASLALNLLGSVGGGIIDPTAMSFEHVPRDGKAYPLKRRRAPCYQISILLVLQKTTRECSHTMVAFRMSFAATTLSPEDRVMRVAFDRSLIMSECIVKSERLRPMDSVLLFHEQNVIEENEGLCVLANVFPRMGFHNFAYCSSRVRLRSRLHRCNFFWQNVWVRRSEFQRIVDRMHEVNKPQPCVERVNLRRTNEL